MKFAYCTYEGSDMLEAMDSVLNIPRSSCLEQNSSFLMQNSIIVNAEFIILNSKFIICNAKYLMAQPAGHLRTVELKRRGAEAADVFLCNHTWNLSEISLGIRCWWGVVGVLAVAERWLGGEQRASEGSGGRRRRRLAPGGVHTQHTVQPVAGVTPTRRCLQLDEAAGGRRQLRLVVKQRGVHERAAHVRLQRFQVADTVREHLSVAFGRGQLTEQQYVAKLQPRGGGGGRLRLVHPARCQHNWHWQQQLRRSVRRPRVVDRVYQPPEARLTLLAACSWLRGPRRPRGRRQPPPPHRIPRRGPA